MSTFASIVREPVEKITSKIVDSENNLIFLTGVEGSGKTTVLDNLKNRQGIQTQEFVDVSPSYQDLNMYTGPETYKLYQTCLIIQKSLLSILRNFPQVAINFEKFYFFITRIIHQINNIHILGIFDDSYLKKHSVEFKDVTSESLIYTFLELKQKYLRDVNLTMIFDSFDKAANTYPTYQKHVYSILKNRLSMIIAVSDPKVLNNPSLLDEDSEIINVSYSTDLDIVKQILDNFMVSEAINLKCFDFKFRLRFILSDDAIKRLISETNGNIADMKMAIYYLLSQIIKFGKIDYEDVLFRFVKREINFNPIIRGYAKPERCLRIV